MFKSVFTKYMITFMLIIVVSFSILAAITSTMVYNYSLQSQEETISHTTSAAKMYLEIEYSMSAYSDFNQYSYFNREQAANYLNVLSSFSGDFCILVCDLGGNILIASGNESVKSSTVPGEIIAAAVGGEKRMSGDFGGLFESQHITFGMPIESKNSTGEAQAVAVVFVSVSTGELDVLVENMIKTIILTTLWVLLASLIAIYFISDRITTPLKDMSKAARSFASGDFKVRVPVHGRDEVAELATAFNNMATSLEHVDEMRSTFLANVSHDLRTPMTTISGFIDNIIDGIIPPEKHAYYLGVVSQEVKRLARLVMSLLDITRIQAGERKFTPVPFDICEMGRQIVISFEQKIDAKHLDVDFECDEDSMFVNADRDAIYQIFYNICDNGVKFSREGGKFAVRIISKDKKVYISVYNEGQGIPEDELPYVFDRFYKSDRSRGLDKTGTGLGLFIAKTIIDAHNEEIWVKSVYGEYCEFVFTLPYTHEVPKKADGTYSS